MKCKESKIMASAYLDRQLSAGETAIYRNHLQSCSGCQSYLGDLELVGLAIGNLRPVETPAELRGYVMSGVRRCAAGDIRISQRILEACLKLNPRVVAYSIGLLTSAVLFAMTLSGFRSIPSFRVITAKYTGAIFGSDQEFHAFNNLPPDSGNGSQNHSFEFPRVGDTSSLISFSNISYRNPGDEEASAVVEVSPDGKGRIVRVLEMPNDPSVLGDLQWSLSKQPFQPAFMSGHPILTRIVLMVQKVDVTG